MNDTVVKIRDLHVKLSGAHILRGIDLDVDAGKTVAVLGANGSGKSTLIRAMVGALPRAHGTVELFGAALGSRKVPWHRIGYAPQRITATSGVPATALETVRSGLVHGWKLHYGRGANDKALAALRKVGMEARAHDTVHTFSGGQQQRVLIARALVKNPDLLVLDEPFAGVDHASRERIIKVLEELRAAGTTLIIILHELYELEHVIDESYTLAHGKILEHNTDMHAMVGHGPHAHRDHDHQHAHEDDPPHYRTPVMKGLH
ncbi:MAG: ATP-binding cassette domain-containing protein [Actinomycetaceae bacterium]|nr:ATP-binding cassette domain-containing protein [Actinomycetaceae bacterium]